MRVLVAAVLDAALVVVFALVGRASHHESDTAVLGFLRTAWPFAAGAAIGWVSLRVWREPIRVRWSGIAVWLGAVVGGMLLRVVSDQGVAVSFVIVAAVVLGVFLVGWRALAALLLRIRHASNQESRPGIRKPDRGRS